MIKKNEKLKVIQDPKDPVKAEIIATSIRDVAAGMRAINASSLNKRAMLVLLKDATNIPMSEIDRLLSAMTNLERLYLK
jgi:hypothetical protein